MDDDRLPQDGPYCSTCQVHRVLKPGDECPVCLSDPRRP